MHFRPLGLSSVPGVLEAIKSWGGGGGGKWGGGRNWG